MAARKTKENAKTKTVKENKKNTARVAAVDKKSTVNKRSVGRPKKVDPIELANGVDEYIASTPLPILAEYAHMNGITREYLYELAANEKEKGHQELSYAIKKLSEAKEIALEKGGLTGAFQPTVAVFSLKQLGWRDRKEEVITASTEDEATTGVIMIAPVLEKGKEE